MLITTSRNPNHRLRRVSRVISLSFPNSQRMNRGTLSLSRLFTYCWNKKIGNLLILQESDENNAILVKAYSIRNQPQLIDATIRLTNIVSLRKHSKKYRINIERICINFSEDINKLFKDQITDFFHQIIPDSNNVHSKKKLVISFGKDKFNSLIGHAVQQNSTKSLHLFTIHVSSECVNNE
ncbi:MAG: Brix domain-containing protein [Promethearchaeota archaeon]